MGCSSSLVTKWHGIFCFPASLSLVLKLNLFLILWLFVSAESEKTALLQFRDSVSDSAGLLSSWNSVGNHCSWYGILCDSKSRVVAINVTGNGNNRGNSDPNKPSPCLNSDEFPLYRVGIRSRGCLGVKGKLMGNLSPSIAKLGELRVLSLPFNGFTGEIPGEIWGSDKLEVVDLEGNSMTGMLPGRFGKSLRVLNLGFNKIEGEIPSSLSDCKALKILNLAANRVNGTVPAFIGRLRAVHLSYNWLAGEIPPEIGKECRSLEHLDLSGNFLVRGIPSSLGNCGELRTLMLYSNMLEESLPEEIGRLKKLEVLDVSRNMLSGPVPSQLGNCSSLSVLVLSNLHNPLPMMNLTGDSPLSDQLSSGYDDFNFFQGAIPEEVAALPELNILWAPRATLEGKLPRSWGSCANLEMLNLGQNYISGEIPVSIAACKKLRFLNIGSNRLSGGLVRGLPAHCISVLDVSGNAFSGPIIDFNNSTCDLVSRDFPSPYRDFFASKSREGYSLQLGVQDGELLVVHNFGNNNFTGTLPAMKTVAGEGSVYAFLAGGNKLSGEFPGRLFDACGVLGGLIVNISYNWISGPIPDGVGKTCDSLRVLDISGNQISGIIPASIGGVVSLVSLNLSRNSLQGNIPGSLGRAKEMKYLSLSGNNLSGSIPESLGELQSLRWLDLSWNSLTGPIPEGLGELGSLTVLLLHNNKLSGQIPRGLGPLFSFNVSFNNLSGLHGDLIKCSSAMGNPLIRSCFTEPSPEEGEESGGGGWERRRRKEGRLGSMETASVTVASAVASVLVALGVVLVYSRRWKVVRESKKGAGSKVVMFREIGVAVTVEGVVRGTGGWSAGNCIGSGGFGATYRAELGAGRRVAIKRLAVGRCQGVQQFEAEIKTLGRLQHPNLVTLVGYHASEGERFLVYNYLAGGNLEHFIRDGPGREWGPVRGIALDVARALAYLHEECAPRVLHRDVKPSNILLDAQLRAHLSDFGVARLLGSSETHATTGVAGTFGYVAPEYAMTCRVSEKSDVYSYGVVLLELVSDKKALDPSFSPYGNGFNIVHWACMLLHHSRPHLFFTPALWAHAPRPHLLSLLHLALLCTQDSLSARPSMRHVLRHLNTLQS